MAYKLIDATQARWRAVNRTPGPLVRAGAVFHKGKLLERPVEITVTDDGPEHAGPKSHEASAVVRHRVRRKIFSEPVRGPLLPVDSSGPRPVGKMSERLCFRDGA